MSTLSASSSATNEPSHIEIPDDDPFLVGYFGLDLELRRSRLAKFNESDKLLRCLEFLARKVPPECVAAHLQRVLEQTKGSSTPDVGSARLGVLQTALKNGVLLCELSNSLFLGSIPKYNKTTKNVLQERENVDKFLSSLDLHRVRPEERFTPADLHSGRDMIVVVDCLLALERVIELGRGVYDPTKASLNIPLVEAVDAGPAVNQASKDLSERGYYGLGAEVQERLESKFDEKRTAAALTWLRRVTGKDVRSMNQLTDGVILCLAMNAQHAGAIPRFHKNSKIKMMWRENVQMYLQACTRVGMAQTDLFNVDDLIDLKYPVGVVDNIFALGRYTPSTFKGARLQVRRGESRIFSMSGRDVSKTERQSGGGDEIAVDLDIDEPSSPRSPSSPRQATSSTSAPRSPTSAPRSPKSAPRSPTSSRQAAALSSPHLSPKTSRQAAASPRQLSPAAARRAQQQASSNGDEALTKRASKRNSLVVGTHRGGVEDSGEERGPMPQRYSSTMFQPPEQPIEVTPIQALAPNREAGCFATLSYCVVM